MGLLVMSTVQPAPHKPSDKVRAYLEKEERLGKLPVGSRLPTASELATALSVSSGTVKNVYRQLAKEGRVRTLVGVGSFWLSEAQRDPWTGMRIGFSMKLQREAKGKWWTRSAWVGPVYGGILQKKLDAKLDLSLHTCGDLSDTPQEELPQALGSVDGVISLSIAALPERLLNAAGRLIPHVALNPPSDHATVNFVSPDYFLCSQALGDAWRRTGRRRILFVSTRDLLSSVSTRQRYSGLLCGIGKTIGNPIEVQIFINHASTAAEQTTAMKRFLDRGWVPDAIYCTGYSLAIHTLTALRTLGVSVPEEVSLVSGSQNGFRPTPFHAISMMIHPLEEVGARLLEMLFARIASGGGDQPGRYEAVAFSIGSTTRSAENELLLRHSRAAFAAAESPSSPPKQSKIQTHPSMSDNTTTPIPVAIVGLGRAGWGLHLQPFLKLPGFKIVGVADPVAERCKEAADLTGCEQYNNIDELLKATSASVVVIATPSAMHYSDALKVLNSGRHCILEKPIAMSACEANELVELAKKLNLKLFVNHTHLHRAEFPHLQEVIKSGILGPLFHIRAFWGGYARRWDWQTLQKNGGGALNNTCPHMLSIILPLLGSPVTNLYSDLRNIKDAGDAEDHVHLVLRTDNGPTADIVVSTAIALGMPKWTICGKYGTLQSDGVTSKLRYYNPAKATPLSVLDAAAPDRKYLREELPWEEKEITVPEATSKPFHENIYDVLIHGAPQIVTPESAAEVVRVTELAHQSAIRN